MVGHSEHDDLLTTEVLGAIAHFIERQALVARIMQDLDIDLDDVGRWGAAIWTQQGGKGPPLSLPASASDESRELWEAIRRARSRRPVAQQGTWGDAQEWQYFFHGKGCRLRNTLTGEVIDWDCPNVEAFDPYCFLDHLRWRLETQDERHLPQIREWVSHSSQGLEMEIIIQRLNQLVEEGLINPDWTLQVFPPRYLNP